MNLPNPWKARKLNFYIYSFLRNELDFIYQTDRELNDRQREALEYLTNRSHTEIVYGGAAGGAKSWTGWRSATCATRIRGYRGRATACKAADRKNRWRGMG